MKVWLLTPPPQRKRHDNMAPVVENLFYNSPPLGLGYIAAVLEQAGISVTLTDCPAEGIYDDQLGPFAKALKPDLVGITSTTTYYHNAVSAAQALRNALPKVPIAIGGPHFNANPEILAQEPSFSLGVAGEGEYTFLDVAKKVDAGESFEDVPGVATAQDGEIKFAPSRGRIEKLDELPFPSRHLMPMSRYRPMPNDQYRLPKTSMITSRGCPYQCTFCDKSTFGAAYRGFGPERIVEEMHELADHYRIRDIAFVDSTFTPTKKRIEGFLDALEANPPKVTWTCSIRANVLEEDQLKRMHEAGCWRVRVGIESGNKDVLTSIQKGITIEEVEKTVNLANRIGFEVKSFFMVGHVGESKKSIEDSINLALRLPLKDITVQINTPLKGTKSYIQAQDPQNGTMMEVDTSRYSFFQPVFVPTGFTVDELIKAHARFYRRFYLRPITIWRHLKSIRRFSDITKYLRALPLVLNLMFRKRLS